MSTAAAPAPPPAAGFNADQRASSRENAAVTINGVAFYPVRRTTDVMRAVRGIGRDQERIGRQQARLAREADDALYVRGTNAQGEATLEPRDFASEDEREAAEAKVDHLNAEADKLADQATGLTFAMLAVLLVREDRQTHPEPDELAGGLDLIHAESLSAYLMGEAENAPDPSTPTPTTSG